jgi:hypothetical protein
MPRSFSFILKIKINNRLSHGPNTMAFHSLENAAGGAQHKVASPVEGKAGNGRERGSRAAAAGFGS